MTEALLITVVGQPQSAMPQPGADVGQLRLDILQVFRDDGKSNFAYGRAHQLPESPHDVIRDQLAPVVRSLYHPFDAIVTLAKDGARSGPPFLMESHGTNGRPIAGRSILDQSPDLVDRHPSLPLPQVLPYSPQSSD